VQWVNHEIRRSKLTWVVPLKVMQMCAHRISTMVAVAPLMGVIGIAQTPSLARAASTPAGEVTVPQSALNSLIGEPDRHFHRAADLYAKGDAQGAASEIRAAAALIRIEAGRGSGQDAAKLQTAATDLETVADNVVKGNVASRHDLNVASARADIALAAHYRSLADKALADKDRADAGRWLKAAGDSVDEAAVWTGQSPSGAQAQVWDQMHALQAKIRTGANWSYDEAKKGIGYLGTQMQYLGQQMQNVGGSSAKSGAN
jgi:hypothetical protein